MRLTKKNVGDIVTKHEFFRHYEVMKVSKKLVTFKDELGKWTTPNDDEFIIIERRKK